MEHPQRLDVAKQAAHSAGRLLLKKLGHVIVEQKQSYNLVTDADVEAEETICSLIRQHFPGDSILREEGDSDGALQDPHLWIIDPLDGTNNFAHGIPQFSVSIAYCEEGVPQIGVVLDPVRDEMFWAVRSESTMSFLNAKPIRGSQNKTLQDSIISVGFYYERGDMMRKTLQSVQRLFEVPIQGIRRFGSAALDICWVACGRVDGYFEYRLSPWDYTAAWLILEGSGGMASDRLGRPMQIGAGNFVASNEFIHPALLNVVRWQDEQTNKIESLPSER